jgi:hypothetical protein
LPSQLQGQRPVATLPWCYRFHGDDKSI